MGFGSQTAREGLGAEVARASDWHESCLRGLLAPPGWGRMG